MYKGLVDNLAFTYLFICKARGKVQQEELQAVATGARTMTRHAPEVLGREDQVEGADDRADLAEAGKIADHIDEMVVFLQSLEIV